MNSMHRLLRRAIWALGVLALASALAGTAAAQTPEGTVIRNIATVTFTDANNNAYTPVADTVDVTVGFVAGLNVTGAASVTPASPSTGNTLTFTIANIGNGNDSVSVSEAISVGGVISVTGYVYNATNYGSLAALNTALSTVTIAQGGSIDIDVTYDVLAGQGGNSTSYTLTGTSRRDNAVTDNATTVINPTQNFGVAVTPDGGQNLQHLPTNGGAPYQFTFTVQNTGNGTETYDLSATSPGSAAITIVSVNGTAGSTATVAGVAPGGSASIVVQYTIASVAAGTTDTLYLAATSQASPGTTDDGFIDVTVIRPSLTIAKQAFQDDQVTPVGGTVLPGDFIQYHVTVTNTGTAPAASVVVTDDLQVADITFVSTQNVGGAWASIAFASPTVTATLSGPLAASGSAEFWIRVQVN
jgi:uncharacterized repeat protein (TIGR01451 family)